MPHQPRLYRKYLCTGTIVTKFAVAVMNWTRPSPVVEYGDNILNTEFAVGNDSPSTQSVGLSSKRAVKLR